MGGGDSAWEVIEAEARDAFVGDGRFPLPAYSEFMPAPHVVLKPYDPRRAARAATVTGDGQGRGHGQGQGEGEGGDGFEITEYDQAHELDPGLAKIAGHVLAELDRLVRGKPHALSRSLLTDNPAWPSALGASASARRAAGEPLVLALSLALSLTQDDKGNARWTLFGVSHDGPAAALWRSFAAGDGDAARARFARFLAWAAGPGASADGVRVVADPAELAELATVADVARALVLGDGQPLDGVHTVVSFRPFAELPLPVQGAYLAGTLRLVPHPASLVFFGHPGYRRLGATLPRATQIPLLHLFPQVEGGYGIRIPQSGWLDEGTHARGPGPSGHRLVRHVRRSHRWQRMARDEAVTDPSKFAHKVSVALFSTDPDDLGLYGKPMARNAQIWSEDYALVLDGPRATPLEIERAEATLGRGGRFGYRFIDPAMRAGAREIYWHRPLLARLGAGDGAEVELFDGPPLEGYLQAETLPERGAGARPPLALAPRLLRRPGHVEAATLFDHDPGRLRFTNGNNVRKLLEFRELLGAPLLPSRTAPAASPS
jgi:hypothetical protein